MNHQTLIGIIVVISVSVGTILAFINVVNSHIISAKQMGDATQVNGLVLTNVIVENVSNNGAKHVRIQVRNEGAGILNLNDTMIELRTSKGYADLVYRNGTTVRDQTNGFYTLDTQ